jgi:hypothetical protein
MMAKKIRMTITFVQEYEPDAEWYADCETIEQMAEVDERQFREDPMLMIDNEATRMITKYEIVDTGE